VRFSSDGDDYCVSGGFRSTVPSGNAVPLTDNASSNRLGLSALAASVCRDRHSESHYQNESNE